MSVGHGSLFLPALPIEVDLWLAIGDWRSALGIAAAPMTGQQQRGIKGGGKGCRGDGDAGGGVFCWAALSGTACMEEGMGV